MTRPTPPAVLLALAAALSALSPPPAAAQAGGGKPPPSDPGGKAPAPPGGPEALLAEATRGSDFESCFGGVRLRDAGIGPVRRAGPGAPAPVRRLVLAVDSSGSMSGRAGGAAGTKMEAAKRAAAAFLARVPPDVEVALLAFGHRGSPRPEDRALSCRAGGETLFPVGADRSALDAAVANMRPAGWTPLAAALEQAGALLSPDAENAGEQVVWVVSDGVETCGGDPVAAARALHGGGARAVVNVIGFDVQPKERAALEAVARAGGGAFLPARTDRELQAAFERAREAIDRDRAKTAAVTAQFGNTLAALRRTDELWACFNAKAAAETDRLIDMETRGRADGADSPGDWAAASRLLGARHRALTERVTAYADALRASDEAKAAEIEAELGRALNPPPR